MDKNKFNLCDNSSINATFTFLQNNLIHNYRLHTMIWQIVPQVQNNKWVEKNPLKYDK